MMTVGRHATRAVQVQAVNGAPASIKGAARNLPDRAHAAPSPGPCFDFTRIATDTPRLPLQRKLAVGAADDEFEKEADRVADRVMRVPEPMPHRVGAAPERVVARKCACGKAAGDSEECAECKQARRDELQRRAVGAPAAETAPPIVHEALRTPGRPLDSAARAFFEPRFGHDFSRVRVHSDERAAQSAQSVNSLAYTVGQDVVFATGQYAPHTTSGRQLLAHELTHVIQQSSGGSRSWQDAAARPSARAGAALPIRPATTRVQRLEWYGYVTRFFGIETGEFSDDDLIEYLDRISQNRKCDCGPLDFLSDDRARALVSRWGVKGKSLDQGYKGLSSLELKRILIQEMLSGVTTGSDEAAITTIFRKSDPTEVKNLLDPAKGLSIKNLEDSFGGDAMKALRQVLDAKQPAAAAGSAAPVGPAATDADALADQLHDAITTAAANELIYVALQKVRGDVTAISSLKDAYLKRYKTDLLGALGSRLKDRGLGLAKTLLGATGGLPVATAPPDSRADFEGVARTVNAALLATTVDAEGVYAALLPLALNAGRTAMLKKTYADLFSTALEAHLTTKLTGAGQSYALYLLNAPGPASPRTLPGIKAQPGPGDAPKTAPPPAPGGTVSVATKVPYETTTGKTGTYGFGVGYSGALASDTRWLQFIEREIDYTPKGGGKPVALDKEISSGGGKNTYRLTTVSTSPNWVVDSYDPSNPFFDETHPSWREVKSVSIYDAPVPRDDLFKDLLDDGASAVTSRAHFDIYLIRDFSAIYHVEIEMTWRYSAPDKHTTDRDVKSTGPVSGLPSPLSAALVKRYPAYAYIR